MNITKFQWSRITTYWTLLAYLTDNHVPYNFFPSDDDAGSRQLCQWLSVCDVSWCQESGDPKPVRRDQRWANVKKFKWSGITTSWKLVSYSTCNHVPYPFLSSDVVILDPGNSAIGGVSETTVREEVSESKDQEPVAQDHGCVNDTKLWWSGIMMFWKPLTYATGSYVPYPLFPVMTWWCWIWATVPVVGCLWHQSVIRCQRVWTPNPWQKTKGLLALPNSSGME